MSVLQIIANFTADFVSTQGNPCPKSVIVGSLGLTDYQYRKEIKKLTEDGLIRFERWVEHDEYDTFFIQGWYLTDKGRETEEYKKAHERVREVFKDVYGFDIGS